ncbi:MAG: hypothetical protein M3Q71_23240 [Chloroflexota bacterium]|nr:hypothetical protein [Chloroflexota bacterium]
MARGLSDLQKQILQLAYRNHVVEWLDDPVYDVEVVEEVPDLPPRPAVTADGGGDEFSQRLAERQWKEEVSRRHDRAESALRERLAPVVTTRIVWRAGDKTHAIAIVGERQPRPEADALASQLVAQGLPAKVLRSDTRQYDQVLVFVRPDDHDLRERVPEAFPPAWPDGHWHSSGCLMVGCFRTRRGVEGFAKELEGRGLSAGTDMSHQMPWDLTFAEVMIRCFDAPAGRQWPSAPAGYPRAVIERPHLRLDRAAMGSARYTAAAVSVSRAFDRLATRGLVETAGFWRGTRWHNCSVSLTDTGIAVARELTANTCYIITSVSQYIEMRAGEDRERRGYDIPLMREEANGAGIDEIQHLLQALGVPT